MSLLYTKKLLKQHLMIFENISPEFQTFSIIQNSI